MIEKSNDLVYFILKLKNYNQNIWPISKKRFWVQSWSILDRIIAEKRFRNIFELYFKTDIEAATIL